MSRELISEEDINVQFVQHEAGYEKCKPMKIVDAQTGKILS